MRNFVSRYDVHTRLVSFMAPQQRGTMADSSRFVEIDKKYCMIFQKNHKYFEIRNYVSIYFLVFPHVSSRRNSFFNSNITILKVCAKKC